MARVTAEELRAMAQPYLPEGEAPRHAAYGVRQPHILLIVLFILIGILPGLLLVHFRTKHYVLALGDRTLAVIQVTPAFWKLRLEPKAVKSTRLLPLAEVRSAGAKTSTGGLFTHIAFGTKPNDFRAKFHRAFSKENRPEAMAIGAALAG
jgi:hypothetical protein